MDKITAKNLISQYNSYPWMFNKSQIDELHKLSTEFNIPFQKRTIAESDDTLLENVGRTVANAGIGLVEGFTGIKTGVFKPNDPVEQIAHDVAHLIGFIGIIPGIGTGVSAGVKGTTLATKAGIKATTILGKKAVTGASIPMMGAHIIQTHLGKAVKTLLGQKAIDRIGSKTIGKLGTILAKDAFHLGTASAISTWTEGVDSMMDAFVGGSVAGAGFSALGFIPEFGAGKLSPFVRVIATSLFTGLPATLQERTAPEQVYEYLLGAWFGRSGRPGGMSASKYIDFKFKTAIGKAAEATIEYANFFNPEVAKLTELLSPSFGTIYEKGGKYYQVTGLSKGKKAFKAPLDVTELQPGNFDFNEKQFYQKGNVITDKKEIADILIGNVPSILSPGGEYKEIKFTDQPLEPGSVVKYAFPKQKEQEYEVVDYFGVKDEKRAYIVKPVGLKDYKELPKAFLTEANIVRPPGVEHRIRDSKEIPIIGPETGDTGIVETVRIRDESLSTKSLFTRVDDRLGADYKAAEAVKKSIRDNLHLNQDEYIKTVKEEVGSHLNKVFRNKREETKTLTAIYNANKHSTKAHRVIITSDGKIMSEQDINPDTPIYKIKSHFDRVLEVLGIKSEAGVIEDSRGKPGEMIGHAKFGSPVAAGSPE